VTLKQAINAALARTTGYQLQKSRVRLPPRLEARPGDRLLERPAFVLCSVRSGSTLLRVLLNSHSQIHSPHEMHLRDLAVEVKSDYAQRSLAESGLDARAVEHLLWDRLLHRELTSAGKHWLVNKTPSDVWEADRILECWPDARFIFLLRSPAAIARSRQAARPQDTPERNVEMVRRYVQAVEDARRTYSGLTVRYEDLAADPATEMRRVCEFLGVEWEPAMLDYGRYEHGSFRSGLGDWSQNIRSGEVRHPEPPPAFEETPEPLRAIAREWGYEARQATPAS
jgi:hypothetical protein